MKFKGGSNEYGYGMDRLKCVERHDVTLFDYFIGVSNLVKITDNDGNEVNLAKNLEHLREGIDVESVLWPYLNPKSKIKAFDEPAKVVFPFGANSSQLKALRNALTSQLSII